MTGKPYTYALAIIVIQTVIASAISFGDALMYRPGQEYRSLNSGSYEIGIQKNGRLDVGFSTGEPVFLNAFPMVWIDGEKEAKAARLDGRLSNRFEVNDAMGRGQGMRIQYKQNLWTLNSYPTKPYLTVQSSYTNTSKKPVKIKQLIPWAIGEPKKGVIDLGENSLNSLILENALANTPAKRTTRESNSANMITVVNEATGRNLVMGFLTQEQSYGSIDIAGRDVDEKEPHTLDYMRATCTYDPPITVQPGETLFSEVLYLAIAETEPLLAMERYAKGVAVTNHIPVYEKTPPHTVWVNQGRSTADELAVRIDNTMANFTKTFPIDKSKQLVLELNLHNDTEFIRQLSDRVRQQGFQFGFVENPFAFISESSLVKEHPDWFLSIPNSPGASNRLIDVTNPAAQRWFQGYMKQRVSQLGIDALWGVDPTGYLNIEENELAVGATLTKIEVVNLAMQNLRNAISLKTPIMFAVQKEQGGSPDLLPVYPNAHPVYASDAHHPERFFMAPHLGLPYRLGPETITTSHYASSLVNGIHTIEKPDALTQLRESISTLLTPSFLRPAKPSDLLLNDSPSLWMKGGVGQTGQWLMAGVQNISDESRTITLPLSNPKLRIQPQYTLFDAEQSRYFGKAQNQININVPANSTRVMILREVRNQPILVGTRFPIAESLPEMTKERWDVVRSRMSGTIRTQSTGGTLYILVPRRFKAVQGTVNGQSAQWSLHDELIHLAVPAGTASPIEWSLTFTQ